MVDVTVWTLRTAVKITWYLLAVIPGYALMMTHLGIARLRGYNTKPLPTAVYRLGGAVVSTAMWLILLLVIGLLSNPAAGDPVR